MNPEKIIYFTLLAGCILLALVLEFAIPVLDGMFNPGDPVTIYAEYFMALVTMAGVYIALKYFRDPTARQSFIERLLCKLPEDNRLAFRSYAVLRMSILEGIMILNTVFYHAFMSPSFFYLSLIGLAAYPFVYPSRNH